MNRPNLSVIKRCSKCRQWRSVRLFGKNSKAMDGLQSQCGPCVSAATKKWREANPDKWRAARAKWKVENPDKVRAIHRNTGHKRDSQKKKGIGSAALLAWERSQPKVCHWCGSKCPTGWHTDHRVPLAKGGEHGLRNLVISCAGCNLRKGARDPIEFAQSIGKLL